MSLFTDLFKKHSVPSPVPVLLPPINPQQYGFGLVSVLDFGAKADGVTDDIIAFEKAMNFVFDNPRIHTLRIPSGYNYFLSRPWLIRKIVNGDWQQVSIKITGDVECEHCPTGVRANIYSASKSGFAIGVQKGKGVQIENIAFTSVYKTPAVNVQNIGVIKYDEWSNGTASDKRFAPNCCIAIDMFCDKKQIAPEDMYEGMESEYLENTGRGGSTGISIRHCSMNGHLIGIGIGLNGYTQNADIINIHDNSIDNCRTLVAIGQDQSKSISIKGLKNWTCFHTALDGLRYGAGTGGGSTYCENWNLAGLGNQLIWINTSRFPISLIHIYSESLFRLGMSYGIAPNFIDCEIDLLTQPGVPAPDFILIGDATWYGGSLRYYDGNIKHRLNFTTDGFTRHGIMFRDMTMSNRPLTTGLYGIPTNGYWEPMFENATEYYSGKQISGIKDEVTQLWPIDTPIIDRSTWTGTITGAGLGAKVAVGDYLIGEPTANTCKFYDYDAGFCPTRQIGEITAIEEDKVSFQYVGLNVYTESEWGRIFISKLK